MDKIKLRDGLMEQLWRMYSMDIMLYLREFLVGETALLECIASAKRTLTPGEISELMHLSRARTANILRTLREKGYVTMQVGEDDRRKMYVQITAAGAEHLAEKHRFLEGYFDKYIEVLGEKNISDLTALLKLTADSEGELKARFSGGLPG